MKAIEELRKIYIEINDCTKNLPFEVAYQALEKQIPRIVHYFTDEDTFKTTCCDTNVTNTDYNYCPNCGQRLGNVEEIRLLEDLWELKEYDMPEV